MDPKGRMTSRFTATTVSINAHRVCVCPDTNTEEYFAAVAKVYREEIQELYELGCREL
jgi:methionine synthase II (cobalamin-independent)